MRIFSKIILYMIECMYVYSLLRYGIKNYCDGKYKNPKLTIFAYVVIIVSVGYAAVNL